MLSNCNKEEYWFWLPKITASITLMCLLRDLVWGKHLQTRHLNKQNKNKINTYYHVSNISHASYLLGNNTAENLRHQKSTHNESSSSAEVSSVCWPRNECLPTDTELQLDQAFWMKDERGESKACVWSLSCSQTCFAEELQQLSREMRSLYWKTASIYHPFLAVPTQ